MIHIHVEATAENKDEWQFRVEISTPSASSNHLVTLQKNDWSQFVPPHVTPVDMVKTAIDFLITKEEPAHILPQFDLAEMNRYFPDYQRLWLSQ